MSPCAASRALAALGLVGALAGCGPATVTGAASAVTSSAPATSSSTAPEPASTTTDGAGASVPIASGLVAAQYAECDRGTVILAYLATGNNGGWPGLDQLFASYVGVPAPQARALADQWITACNREGARQEAAASSSAAERASKAAASASKATDQAWCEAHGGHFADDGWTTVCGSTVDGNPSGKLGADCGGAYFWPPFTEQALAEVKAAHPDCFP